MAVRMELPAVATRPLVLSSFVQPQAIRVGSLEARQGTTPVSVKRSTDERGFGRWIIGPPPTTGLLTVDYAVRPGAMEEGKMSGPTGYRFGFLDQSFGLFSARQIFLLGLEPSPPLAIRVRFLLPEGQAIISPWQAQGGGTEFEFRGVDAVAQLLKAVIGVGRFETAASETGSFHVHALENLPTGLRRQSMERAVALEAFLTSILGRAPQPFQVILVPKAPDGALISVAPEPGGLGVSLGDGVPTRWLSIGRAIGQAYLAERLAALDAADPGRWVYEALPAFLTVSFSEQDGWRSRQVWNEKFFYHAAGFDLNNPRVAPSPWEREERNVVVLARLAQEMERGGLGSIEDLCRRTLGRGGRLDWEGFVGGLPRELRAGLMAWLGPQPFAVPFPGSPQADPPLRLPEPPALRAAAGAAGRLDLYLGSQNFGLLEQCGCRAKQRGGMARRATVLKRRLRGTVPAVALELGNAVPFDEKSPLLDGPRAREGDLALALLADSGFRASVVSYAELHYGPGYLRDRIAGRPAGFTFLSANVRGSGFDLAPSLHVKGVRPPVRLVGVLDNVSYHLERPLEYEDAISALDIGDPVEAVARVVRDAGAGELTIVAGSIDPSAVMAIQRAVPAVSVIVTDAYFHFDEDARIRFERPIHFSTFGMLGGTLVVVLQGDSAAIIRLGLSRDARGRIDGAELEDIILDESVPDDPGVRARLDGHYARMAAESGLAEVAPIGGPLRDKLDATYVGAEACASCHDAESAQWSATEHAAAFATLLSRRRQGVPGCFACHVTGYRQPGGYRSVTDLPMRHVQCESCHGPGSRHIGDPRSGNIVGVPTASVCRECHTAKHSDMTDENFPDYWSRILHAPGGRGAGSAGPQAPPAGSLR